MSRKSTPFILVALCRLCRTPLVEIFARPGLFAHIELERSETFFQRLQFSTLAPRPGVFGGQFVKVRRTSPVKRSIPLNRNLADFPDQIVLKRKGDIHKPIIRETLNKGQCRIPPVSHGQIQPLPYKKFGHPEQSEGPMHSPAEMQKHNTRELPFREQEVSQNQKASDFSRRNSITLIARHRPQLRRSLAIIAISRRTTIAT